MLGHQLDRMIQVPRFKDEEPSQLLLSLSIRPIRHGPFPILETQSGGVPSAIETFTANNMTVSPKLVVIGEEFLHRGFPLTLRHGLPVDRTEVGHADVFHSDFCFGFISSCLD